MMTGEPPVWTPPKEPPTLKEDSGDYFRDQNAARYPSYPMEPAAQAVLTSKPGFPAQSIEIFGCGSTVGNLLRFVRGKDKAFRILVETVGNTVFLVRRENSPTALIPDVRGYGHTFPAAYTAWNKHVKGSESHQRIIQYGFGGLNLLVRFEADGYLKDVSKTAATSTTKVVSTTSTSELVDALTSSTIKPSIQAHPSSTQDTLKIINELSDSESTITGAMIFDVKTRGVRKKDENTLAEELPRFWVSQISHFVLAYHDRGRFEAYVPVRDVKDEVVEWEKDNQAALSKLANLLSEIVSLGRERGKMELRKAEGVGIGLEVRVWESDPDDGGIQGALSPDVKERWSQQPEDEDAESSKNTTESVTIRDDDAGDLGGVVLEDEDWRDDEDDASEQDFTACSAEDCGYCGHCRY